MPRDLPQNMFDDNLVGFSLLELCSGNSQLF